jgi:hypothetical protein
MRQRKTFPLKTRVYPGIARFIRGYPQLCPVQTGKTLDAPSGCFWVFPSAMRHVAPAWQINAKNTFIYDTFAKNLLQTLIFVNAFPFSSGLKSLLQV